MIVTRPGRTAGRLVAGALVVVATLTGTATAAATPDQGDGGPAGLANLLPDGRQLSRLVADEVTIDGISNRLVNRTVVTPSHCTGAYLAGQARAYDDTEPVAVAGKYLEGDTMGVTEAVVRLPSKAAALQHLKTAADAWADCAGRTLVGQKRDGSDEPQSWRVDAPRVNADQTIVTLDQRAVGSRATCEMAIASYRDLFFDVISCSKTGQSEGTAEAIVETIGRNAQTNTI